MEEEKEEELYLDDEFCLEKERQEMKLEDVKMQTDYASKTGRSFFDG